LKRFTTTLRAWQIVLRKRATAKALSLLHWGKDYYL